MADAESRGMSSGPLPSSAGEPGDRVTCMFRADRLEQIREMEANHFWFVARRALVCDLAARWLSDDARVVDVGCGTGMNLRALVRPGMKAVGIDGRRDGLEGGGAVPFVQADATRLPLQDHWADAVFALDVLEHVDDAAVLDELHRVLRVGGTLIATVPAFTFLWSYRDEDAGHLRRYTPRHLHSVLTSAGFEVLWTNFFGFVLFPAVAAARLVGRARPRVRDAEDRPRGGLNRLLTWIFRAEIAAMRWGVRYPWGSSVVVVARTTSQAAA